MRYKKKCFGEIRILPALLMRPRALLMHNYMRPCALLRPYSCVHVHYSFILVFYSCATNASSCIPHASFCVHVRIVASSYVLVHPCLLLMCPRTLHTRKCCNIVITILQQLPTGCFGVLLQKCSCVVLMVESLEGKEEEVPRPQSSFVHQALSPRDEC